MATANLDVKVLVQIGNGDIIQIGTVAVPVSAVVSKDNYAEKNGLHIDLGYFIKNMRDRYHFTDVTMEADA